MSSTASNASFSEDDASAPGDDDLPDLAAAEAVAAAAAAADARYAEFERRTARTLVLKGHTDAVLCLAALAGDRLASGSLDKSIHIWSLADGPQLTVLEEHTSWVRCLAVLDGGRLASGSWDSSIIIWDLATNPPAWSHKLGEHAGPVTCLAALAEDRLASGSADHSIIIWDLASNPPAWLHKLAKHAGAVFCLAALGGDRLASGSKSIIIWDLASNPPAALHELKGHTDAVFCLAALADGRLLASGSRDNSIIIWNLADSAQLATLEGHTNWVECLAALADGRLASGSSDKSIIIWNVEDGKQLFKLEGHTGIVWSLAALDCGRLASGSFDETIRIRPLAKLADLAACGSTFEFEKVARSHRDKNCLGDLFDAAVVQSEENMGGSSSAAIRQAHVFDAIAKVINAGTDQDEAICSLVPSVHALVRDDALLPDMYRRGVSNAAIQELAQTALFRVVLDAKFAEGPVFVLYIELFLFVVLGCCFTRVVAFDVLGVSKWFAAEKIVEIVFAFLILTWFSGREVYQMWITRAIELATPENPFIDWDGGDKVEGLAKYALLIPRLLVGFVVCLPLLPVYLVIFGLACAGKKYDWIKAIRSVPSPRVTSSPIDIHAGLRGRSQETSQGPRCRLGCRLDTCPLVGCCAK